MGTINIPESEANVYEQFIAGEPVRIRGVSLGNEYEFKRGEIVSVAHLNMEGTGRIVSTPRIIDKDDNDKIVFEVTIEKLD